MNIYNNHSHNNLRVIQNADNVQHAVPTNHGPLCKSVIN